jgi:hypothetical protein
LTLGAGLMALATMPAYAAPAITVSPSTALANGQTVTITGSGFAKSSIGNVLECNDDPNEPTADMGGAIGKISVGCSAPSYSKLVSVDASGNVSTTFAVVSGTVGPPCGPSPAAATCPATDSANLAPAADAANYPCPPTPAQQTIGDVCQLSYGDAANESGTANILFGSETPPASTTTTAAGAATTTTTAKTTATTTAAKTTATTTAVSSATTAPATAASSSSTSSLATTGPGPHLWTVAVIGFVVLYLGSVMLALVERPRSLLRRLFRMGRPVPAPATPMGLAQPPFPMASAPQVARDDRVVADEHLSPRPVYPKAGDAQGLWFNGWEPDNQHLK